MTFNENSGLVTLWKDAIKQGGYSIAQVPNIGNLRAMVEFLL